MPCAPLHLAAPASGQPDAGSIEVSDARPRAVCPPFSRPQRRGAGLRHGPGGSSRHEGRAPLPAPGIGQNPVCATTNPGAAALGRAERVLVLVAGKPAPSTHAAAHDCQLPFWRAQAQPASLREGSELAKRSRASLRAYGARRRQGDGGGAQ